MWGEAVAAAAVPGRVCNARAPGEHQASTRPCCMRQPRARARARMRHTRVEAGEGYLRISLRSGEERWRGAAAKSLRGKRVISIC